MNNVQKSVVVNETMETEKITNGAGAAAILAAGIGSATIGVLAFIAELSPPSVRALLNFYNPTGPLSGKTTLTIVVWLVAWFILHQLWKDKTVDMGRVNLGAFVLLAAGLVLTFPPVWYAFAG
jgi:hypothetical protein